MKRLLPAVVLAGLALGASAQTNAPARDFGDGFAMLYRLGLPDVRVAEYGRVRIVYGDSEFAALRPYDYSVLEAVGASGNAWKIRESDGGTNLYVVMPDMRIVGAVHERMYAQRVGRMRAQWSAGRQPVWTDLPEWDDPTFCVVVWEPVDLKRSISNLMVKFEERVGNTTRIGSAIDCGARVQLVLAAAQFHRLGFTNEANRITAEVFSRQSDTKGFLRQVVSAMADTQYQEAYLAFRRTTDWETWHKSLKGLLARFPEGWGRAAAVRKLAGLVRTRLDHPDFPPPTGEGISLRGREWARRLAVETPDGRASPDYYYDSFWLFDAREIAASDDVISCIRSGGMESVGMLMGLLKDRTLTRWNGWRSTGRWRGDRREVKVIEGPFDVIERPMTRGEIARSMLTPTLLVSSGLRERLDSMSEDEFIAECENWHKACGGLSLPELAKVYLEKGDDIQQDRAVQYLMQENVLGPEATEDLMLAAAAKVTDAPFFLAKYARLRGAKASNFVERTAVVLLGTNVAARAADPGAAGAGRRRRDTDDNAVAVVKVMRDAMQVVRLSDLVEEYVTGTQHVAAAFNRLRGQAYREDPNDVLAAVLEGACRSDSPRTRIELLDMGRSACQRVVGRRRSPDAGSRGEGSESARNARFDPVRHVEQWKTLLADMRSDGDKGAVWESAVRAIEHFYGSGGWTEWPAWPIVRSTVWETERLMNTAASLGDLGSAMLRERANALLAGRPVTELPSARNVSSEEREGILRRVLSAADVGAVVAELSLDQRLALRDMGETNRILNMKLRPLADRIVAVEVEGPFKSDAGVRSLKGRDFSGETVRLMLSIAMDLAKEGIPFSLGLNRRPNLCGMEVRLAPVLPQSSREGRPATGTNRQEIAVLTGAVFGCNHFASAWWPTTGGGGTPTRRVTARLSGGAEVGTMLDGMEADVLAMVARHRKISQDLFRKELALIVEQVGAYSVAGVTFQGSADTGTGATIGE